MILVVLSTAAALVGCEQKQPGSPVSESEPHQPELARVMGEMERFAGKLGYSIEGRNQQLAQFYLHEIHEAIEELGEIEQHDGVPIASLSHAIMTPALDPLEQSVSAADWEQAAERYDRLIESCNNCHTAAEHAFIRILPSRGDAPYSQSFSVE